MCKYQHAIVDRKQGDMSVLDDRLRRYKDQRVCFHISKGKDIYICGARNAKYQLQKAINECKAYAGPDLGEKEIEMICARCKRHRNSKGPSIKQHVAKLISERRAQVSNSKALALIEEINTVRSADEKFVREGDFKCSQAATNGGYQSMFDVKYQIILQSTPLLPELCRIVDAYSKHTYFWARYWDCRPHMSEVYVMFYILDHDGIYVPWKEYPADSSVPPMRAYTCVEQSPQDASVIGRPLIYNKTHYGWSFDEKVAYAVRRTYSAF